MTDQKTQGKADANTGKLPANPSDIAGGSNGYNSYINSYNETKKN